MISIVVPVYNEEESLPHFYKELGKNLEKINESFEIVFVNDGSTDRSLEIVKELVSKDKKIKITGFTRNQGKAEALTLGFQKAEGDYIVTLDADLQDKPEEINKLLKEVKSGKYDAVTSWRKNRQDNFLRTVPSKIFNALVFVFRGLKLHDYNSGLKVYTKEAAKSLNLYGGRHRFIPILLDMNGFKVGEVAVEHSPRKYGKAKYGISRLWKDLPDMFTMLFLSRYSRRPMHFFGPLGSLLFLVGIVILIYLSALRFGGERIGDRPLLIFGVLFVISGLQILFTGFLADLLIHFSKTSYKN